MVDLVITDLVMPKMDGIELLEAVKSLRPETEVIVISAQGTIEKAVQAMKLGAFDFIEKPINPRVISLVVERALEKQTLVLQNRDLRSRLEDKFHFRNIVGRSEKMVKIFELIEHIAPYDSSVLILVRADRKGTDRQCHSLQEPTGGHALYQSELRIPE